MPYIPGNEDSEKERSDANRICLDFILNTKVVRGLSDRDFFRRMKVYLASSARIQESHSSFKEYAFAKKTPLKCDGQTLALSLEKAIVERDSTHEFPEAAMPLDKLAALLRAAFGLKENGRWMDGISNANPWPKRAAASGGGLYPLEVYPLVFRNVEGVVPGLYHFNVKQSCLEALNLNLTLEQISSLIPALKDWKNAKVAFLITGIFSRSTIKYGRRGYRFVLIEVGHVQAHLGLAANALGLEYCNFGGGFDREIEEVLGIDGLDEALLGTVIVG